MDASWNLDTVCAAFAEAAVDPSRWNAATEIAANATGGIGAVMFPIRGRLPDLPRSASMAASFEAYVRDGWIERDERYRGVPTLARRGAFSEFDFTTADEIARHPYYQEFLAPHGLRWVCCVSIAFGNDFWSLAIQRTIAQGPFSPEEVKGLAALSRGLASAGALARALGFARIEAALSAFEVSGHAVAVLDRFGKVLGVNGAAERLFGPDLKISEGRLSSSDRRATASLDRALHDLLWRRTEQPLLPPVALPRAGGRPLLAYPLRPPAICADALGRCQAVVVLLDPDRRPLLPEEHLRAAFDLTRAEARIAAHLATGETLEHAAEALGVTYETARSTLKHVFAKTDVSRQSELVALLSKLMIL